MFRTRQPKWRKLENAAKIFPATSGKKDERVFRFSCELTEEVNPEYLQMALDRCMEEFELFSCVMRKGLFWNYLETSEKKPIASEEKKPLCSQIYVRDQKSLLFEVTYFKRRINFETYHALTDGVGAMTFLRVLICHYLKYAHPDKVSGDVSSLLPDGTTEEMEEDGFSKYYTNRYKNENIPKYKAYQLHHRRIDYGSFRMIEGIVSTKQTLQAAKKYHTTLTVFLTSIYLCAIAAQVPPAMKNQVVSLMIPVNLRSLFPSKTMRNFFGWIDLGYDFGRQSREFVDVIAYVSELFKKEITKERMAARMDGLTRFEKNFFVRILPLSLKQAALQIGASFSSSADTAIFSNVGRITMPEDLTPYIELFDLFTSTPKIELCSCSYQDNLVLSFTSVFADTGVERNFFRMLTERGIEVVLDAWTEVGQQENFRDKK